MPTEITLVRIYLKEGDHGHRKGLMAEIFGLLHDRHKVRGVTAFRGIAGFGSSGEVHSTDLLRLTAKLPLVIEFFDTPEVVDAAILALSDLVPNDHMVLWKGTSPSIGPRAGVDPAGAIGEAKAPKL